MCAVRLAKFAKVEYGGKSIDAAALDMMTEVVDGYAYLIHDVDMVEVTKEFYKTMYWADITDDQAKELLGNSYPPPAEMKR